MNVQKTSKEEMQSTNLSYNEEKYPPVEITREFDAPIERLWQAWANPDMMKHWWGPEGFSCPEARMDFHTGGKSLLAMQNPEGHVQYSGGTYEEIIPLEKIVTTDHFTDKHGLAMTAKEAGMQGDWPEESRITIRFKNLGVNASYIHIFHEGIPKVEHDNCVGGWTSSINKLQKFVEHN